MVIVARSGASRTFRLARPELVRGLLGCEEEGEGVGEGEGEGEEGTVGSSPSFGALTEERLR